MERKRIAVAVIFLIVIVLIMDFSLSEDVVTEIQVSNNPPVLFKNIPNQSWPTGQNLVAAFDLDEYFVDLNGDTINYSYSSVENINVIIDSLGIASFYPDSNFTGIRNITFYATDEMGTTESNLVFLFVGADDEPPQWSIPAKSRINIYQSSYVNFTTSWTDNLALKSYYFSINQGAGWVDYPTTTFSGVENISLYGLQISAAPGGTVYWKFCASDTNSNSNCTDEQNFSVIVVEIPPGGEGGTGGISEGGGFGGVGGIAASRVEEVENFTIDPEYFKVSLKQGSTETRILRITNIGSSELSFEIIVVGVEEMVLLSENTFSILSKESKAITLDFTVNPNMTPEQYFGLIIVQSSETKQIPVVIDVNALELDFSVDVEIPEKYRRVMPGELVVANISILNLKDIVEKDMTLYFALKDIYGNIYDTNQEVFVFGSSLSLERNLTVPSEANEGMYLFYASAFSEDARAIDSDLFEVGSRFVFLASLKYSFVFILIFFLAILALILMIVHSRSKEKERILRLYLMLNELKNLIKSEEFEKATALYIRIKRAYGEKVSEKDIKSKEQLKEEIKKLSLKLKKDIKSEGVQKEVKKDIVKTENQKEEVKKEIKSGGIQEEVKKDIKKESVQKEDKTDIKSGGVQKEVKKDIVKTENQKKEDNNNNNNNNKEIKSPEEQIKKEEKNEKK